MVSYAELVEQIKKILPNAQIEEDNNGQLIVYTNLIEEDGEVIEMK